MQKDQTFGQQYEEENSVFGESELDESIEGIRFEGGVNDDSILDKDKTLNDSLQEEDRFEGRAHEDSNEANSDLSSIQVANVSNLHNTSETAHFGDLLTKDPKPQTVTASNPQIKAGEDFDSNEDDASDAASDEELTFQSKKKSDDEIIKELFNQNPKKVQDDFLKQLMKEDEVRAKNIDELRRSMVNNYRMLHEKIKPKNLKEIKSLEKKIDILAKKKRKAPDDYCKMEFYGNKLESLKKVSEILEKDWNQINEEIVELIENQTIDTKRLPEIVESINKRLSIATSKIESRLPIYAKKHEIVASLKDQKVTVIKGRPGCGKSTQVPIILFEENLIPPKKKMFMITPRQVAVTQIFRRVISEMHEEISDQNPYSTLSCSQLTGTLYRFKTDCPLIFCTDVEFYRRLVLTKEIKPEEIEYLVIDEANSKRMYTEVIISVAKKLLKKFSMKVVFLCTSFNTASMNNFFNLGVEDIFDSDRNIIEIKEKNFHTEIAYLPHNGDTENLITEVLQQIEDHIYRSYKKNKCIKDANILIFLSGASEVRRMFKKFQWLDGQEGLINSRLKELNQGLKTSYKLLMACGSNDATFDEELFEENNCQESIKLIFSTKVLETSLTISQLGFVVDFGKECIYIWDYKLGAQRKIMRNISKDTAEQREGRVGRTSRGVCFRMYKEEDFDTMDPTTDSELLYKNIDFLIMSFIWLICESKKGGNIEIEFFERTTDTSDSCGKSGLIEKMAAEILQLDLITKLSEDSVKRSLDLLLHLDLLNNDFLNGQFNKRFGVVLHLNQEPRFGMAIAAAYIAGKEMLEKDPYMAEWILYEVIDVVATNCYNRKIPYDRSSQDDEIAAVFKEATEVAKKYGDFAFNYYIFRYRANKKNLKELGVHEGTIRKFREMQYQIRAKARKLFNLGENYFKNLDAKLVSSASKENDVYKAIIGCLIQGFSVDVSKFINADLGYYHIMIKKPVQFGIESVFCNKLESNQTEAKEVMKNDDFVVMSDVIAKDTILVSHFSFKVPMDIMEKKYSKKLKSFEEIQVNSIASQIYKRDDLPSTILHNLNFRMYYVEQILGEEGYVVEISEKNFIFKLAIKPNSYNTIVKKIEKLISFLSENYFNYSYELGLKCCRVNLGNGLEVLDLMTNNEGVSTYFFMVPRYIIMQEGKEKILEKNDGTVGPWDFLVENLKQYFGLDKKELRMNYDTTFTKINYQSDSSLMNLKFICGNVKTNETVREILRNKIKDWERCGYFCQPELKFCERHLNKDVHCKPIQLRLLFSLSEGKGKVTLSAKGVSSIVALEEHLIEIKSKNTPHPYFGTSFEMKITQNSRSSSDKKIELSNVPTYLDEISIQKYFRSLDMLELRDKVDVNIAKVELLQETPRETIERDIRKVLNNIISKEVKDEALVDQFNLFVGYKFERPHRNIKFCEIRVTSKKLADAFVKHLNGKYYPVGANPCYRIGKQFTHIDDFDEPEFHVKKRGFIKIKTMLENINTNIEDKLREDIKGTNPQYMSTIIAKEKSRISWDEEKLNSIKEEENVKVILKKGSNTELANNAENLLRSYFNGKEIHIKEEYYSYFFGPKGEEFIKRIQAKGENYATIRRIESKSIIVIQEFKNEIEFKFKEEIMKLDNDPIKRHHLKLNPNEIRDRNYQSQLKKEFTEKNYKKGICCQLVIGYHGMVTLECQAEDFERAKDKLISITEKIFSKNKGSSRITCQECGHTGNLVRLLVCKHIFCSSCLQNACMESCKTSNLEKIKNPALPFFKCPHRDCEEPVACIDIFGFMPDRLIESAMEEMIKILCKGGQFFTFNDQFFVKCPGCPMFNKFNKASKSENKCFKCGTELQFPSSQKLSSSLVSSTPRK